VSEDSWERHYKSLVVTDEKTPLIDVFQWAENESLDWDAGITIRKVVVQSVIPSPIKDKP